MYVFQRTPIIRSDVKPWKGLSAGYGIGKINALFPHEEGYGWAREASNMRGLGLEAGRCLAIQAIHPARGAKFGDILASWVDADQGRGSA